MGRYKKYSPEELEQKWEEYKAWCDNQTVLAHDFSAKNSEFVSAELRRSVSYTIEGFCVFIKLTRSAFYQNYRDCKKYKDIVTRMKEESEVDARIKFETGQIPTQLAGLWMSKFGYSTKAQAEISGDDESIRNFLQAVKPSAKDLAKLYEDED